MYMPDVHFVPVKDDTILKMVIQTFFTVWDPKRSVLGSMYQDPTERNHPISHDLNVLPRI